MILRAAMILSLRCGAAGAGSVRLANSVRRQG
jgi:hypothetical protein